MGDNLHYSIIDFFEKRMDGHQAVESWKRVSVQGEVVYEIKRIKFQDVVRVWLSDSYHPDGSEFDNRPNIIKRGDYILIAKPEALCYLESDTNLCIGCGRLREFMGALNSKNVWEYEPPSEEELKARASRKNRF